MHGDVWLGDWWICSGRCGSCPSVARQRRYSDLIPLSSVGVGGAQPSAPIGSPNSCKRTEQRCATCPARELRSRGAVVSKTPVFDPRRPRNCSLRVLLRYSPNTKGLEKSQGYPHL